MAVCRTAYCPIVILRLVKASLCLINQLIASIGLYIAKLCNIFLLSKILTQKFLFSWPESKKTVKISVVLAKMCKRLAPFPICRDL